jgi:hypothetical protein
MENATINILNVIGENVYEEPISNGNSFVKTFDLSDKAKGIYFISVKNGNNHTIKKLILN